MSKTKYPIKVANKLYPANTEVELLKPQDNRVLAMFPNITAKADSKQIAVIFPEREQPTIIHITQLL